MVLIMDKVYYDSDWGKCRIHSLQWIQENEITVFSDKHGKAKYSISTIDGKLLNSGWMELTQGISSHQLDTRIDPKETSLHPMGQRHHLVQEFDLEYENLMMDITTLFREIYLKD